MRAIAMSLEGVGSYKLKRRDVARNGSNQLELVK